MDSKNALDKINRVFKNEIILVGVFVLAAVSSYYSFFFSSDTEKFKNIASNFPPLYLLQPFIIGGSAFLLTALYIGFVPLVLYLIINLIRVNSISRKVIGEGNNEIINSINKKKKIITYITILLIFVPLAYLFGQYK